MKKVLSIITSILLFVNCIFLILVFSVFYYFSNNNIKNIVNSCDFFSLVYINVKDNDNKLLTNINSLYYYLIDNDVDRLKIEDILNSGEIKSKVYLLASNEINYFLTGNEVKRNYNINIHDTKVNVNIDFNIIRDSVHEYLSNLPQWFRNGVIFFNSNLFKIILLSSFIILILLLIIINNLNFFSYMFFSFIYVSFVLMIGSVFCSILFDKIFSSYLLYFLLNDSISLLFNNLFILGSILFLVSSFIIWLIQNIISKKRKKFRPRIKSKYGDNFYY